jgi:non-ribosomal peptide synthase protein (TIGR01720 family)
LSAVETDALLREVPQVYHTQINDVLLAALAQALAAWNGEALQLVKVEGHGREGLFEDVDLSRTVGWFTNLYPLLLDLRAGRDAGTVLKAVKEQLRQVPEGGMGYGLLRYLSGEADGAALLASLPQAEVCFNYLGQLDQALPAAARFVQAQEDVGHEQSLVGWRSHVFDINSSIHEGRLHVLWSYSRNLHRASTVDELANGFIAALRALIAHCQSPDAGGYTASDFPEAELTTDELEAFFDEFGEMDEEVNE